jgi:hypothetical protein
MPMVNRPSEAAQGGFRPLTGSPGAALSHATVEWRLWNGFSQTMNVSGIPSLCRWLIRLAQVGKENTG